MDSRLEDALCLIINKVPKETRKILKKVMELNDEINSGYVDYYDWENYYSDKSEDGLRAYLKKLFMEE